MADDDLFGDSELFAEFDKERDQSGSFILYEKDEQGGQDQSKYIFQFSESSSSDNSDEDEQKLKVKEQSVAYAVGKLQKKHGKHKHVSLQVNGDIADSSGNSSCSDDDTHESDNEMTKDKRVVISAERQAKMTTYKLNFERNKYKRFCNIIDSTRFIHDEESAAVQVIFQNNTFSRKHKTQIEEYIRFLLEEDKKAEQETLQKLDLRSTVPSCSELNDKIPVENRTDRMFQAHSIIGCTQFYAGFVLDTLGWPLVEYNPSLTESWDIPVYEQALTDILPIDEEERKAMARKQERERMKPKCWNCDGEHMLTECKLPRNQMKINENRQAMMANKQKGPEGPKSARYHKETSVEESKFSRFKPGKISKELREALGIGEKQIPFYIYKMRALGYPPGWMEEAKSYPGLSMFDKDGNDIDENIEEGEATPEPVLNVQKIIEYEGFTVQPPDDVVDEAHMFGLPPLQPHQLKSTLVAQMQMQEELKRKQEEFEDQQTTKRQKVSTAEMDLDDEELKDTMISYNPPLPVDTPPSKPPLPLTTPPPTPDGNSRQALSRETSQTPSEVRSESPSLEELEEQYKLLQKTLANESDDSLIVLDSCEDEDSESCLELGDTSQNPIELDTTGGSSPKKMIEISNESADSFDEFEFAKPSLKKTESNASIKTFGELGTGSPVCSSPGTPLVVSGSVEDEKSSFKGSVSISRDYSTPIMKRASSYEALPADSNFAQGIEDHIPFENLPDATGRFNTIRKLVDKIRQYNPMGRKKKKK